MQLPDLIAGAVVRCPGRPCVVAGERTLTFADVDARASRLAGALTAHGRGARVALLAGNEPEYFEIAIAPQDSLLFPIPMFHTSSALAYAFAYLGCTVALLDEFDGAAAVAAMRDHGVSHAVYVPTMLARVVEQLIAAPAALDALR